MIFAFAYESFLSLPFELSKLPAQMTTEGDLQKMAFCSSERRESKRRRFIQCIIKACLQKIPGAIFDCGQRLGCLKLESSN